MLTKIRLLHEEMRRYIYKCGITQHSYDKILQHIDEAPDSRKQRILAFLQAMHIGPWAEYKAVREKPHITEEMWHNYEVMGISGLPEQMMLKAAREKVKKFWQQFIKREKKDVQAQTCDNVEHSQSIE